MLQNTISQMCLAFAAGFFGSALFVIYLKVRLYSNHMEYLAKSVSGRAELVSTLSNRIYLLHGAFDKLKFRCSFTPPVADSPPEFALSFYGHFPVGLSIRTNDQSDNEIEKTSGMDDIQTGDAYFDDLFTVHVRKGQSLGGYLEDPARRGLIVEFLNREGAGLFFEGASARMVFKGLELTEVEPYALKAYLTQIKALEL